MCVILIFAKTALNDFHHWEDYREMLQSVVIILGKNLGHNFHFGVSGTYHHNIIISQYETKSSSCETDTHVMYFALNEKEVAALLLFTG